MIIASFDNIILLLKYYRFSAKDLFISTNICTFAPANEVDKELLILTQIADNFALLYVTNS